MSGRLAVPWSAFGFSALSESQYFCVLFSVQVSRRARRRPSVVSVKLRGACVVRCAACVSPYVCWCLQTGAACDRLSVEQQLDAPRHLFLWQQQCPTTGTCKDGKRTRTHTHTCSVWMFFFFIWSKANTWLRMNKQYERKQQKKLDCKTFFALPTQPSKHVMFSRRGCPEFGWFKFWPAGGSKSGSLSFNCQCCASGLRDSCVIH